MNTTSKQKRLSAFTTALGSFALAMSVVSHDGRAGEAHETTAAGSSRIAGTETFLAWDESLRRRLDALPARNVEAMYLHCVRLSTETRLTGSEAATCSVVYDVLLRSRFGGDFNALLNWSKD